jgi:membrane protease subunit HflC
MIRSQADRQAGELLAKASAEAERIRGEGDAEAIRILNEAYARDPEFAKFVQTLEAYKQILNERTTLVLSASNSLLKLLVEGIPTSRREEPQEAPQTGQVKTEEADFAEPAKADESANAVDATAAKERP